MFRSGTGSCSEEYQAHASLDPGHVPAGPNERPKTWHIDGKRGLVDKVRVCGTAANFFSLSRLIYSLVPDNVALSS